MQREDPQVEKEIIGSKAEPRPITNNRPLRNVLSTRADGRGPVDITTPAQWAKKRKALKRTIEEYLGVPGVLDAPFEGMRIIEEHKDPEYRRLKVLYEAAAGDPVPAWLLLPPAARRKNGAAVLCRHGTSPEAKDAQIGAGVKPGRDFARQLALRGFITLAPDHFCAGERQPAGIKPYETAPFQNRHPDWSAAGKTIHDGRRAVDVLAMMDEVDETRIGTVGHSLGGYGSFFLAAFDERIKAAVSSCGLTSWQGNHKAAANWAREEWYCHFPQLRHILQTQAPLPFDMYEFIALAAPRAFLNISGLSDDMYGNNQTLGDVGLQLHALWELLGRNEAFAMFLFGGGHDVPPYSRELIAAWLERWLV